MSRLACLVALLTPLSLWAQPAQTTTKVPQGDTIRTTPAPTPSGVGSSALQPPKATKDDRAPPTVSPATQAATPVKKVARTKPPSVKMECLPNPVRIGEPLTCTVTIIHRANISVSLTTPDEARVKPAGAAAPHGANRLKTTRVFDVMAKSMRKTKVEGLEVVWTEPDGAEGRAPIPSQKIPSASVMMDADDPQFRTFKAPQVDAETFWRRHGPVPYRVTNWTAIVISIAVLVISLGFGIGYFVRRWLDSRRSEPEVWVDPRPAHVIALERLENLIAEDLPSQERIDEYYVRISEIVRGYLERRYGINGLEMTSDEIRAWCMAGDLSPETRAGFDAFLADSDLVKFADFRPSNQAIETIAKQARGLIVLTQEHSIEHETAPAVTTSPSTTQASDELDASTHAWAPSEQQAKRELGQPPPGTRDGEARS
ncbi:MAG: hypothetical protein VX589_08725 [Myxococcota bacterium]|nr:hypothetical protein [Myxococcota bacterium]